MSMKKIQFLVASGVVGFACLASAQTSFTGFLYGYDQAPEPEIGSFTSSSLTLDGANYSSQFNGGESGTFLATIPAGSEITASTSTLGGLSSTPISENVVLFDFASQGPLSTGTGTTPSDRFTYDLSSLSETYDSATQLAKFNGIGTLVDDQGLYANTLADLIITFSGPNTYSFTLQAEAVPEPATFSLVAAGMLGALVFRRRNT
jgi:hypothetical protein